MTNSLIARVGPLGNKRVLELRLEDAVRQRELDLRVVERRDVLPLAVLLWEMIAVFVVESVARIYSWRDTLTRR